MQFSKSNLQYASRSPHSPSLRCQEKPYRTSAYVGMPLNERHTVTSTGAKRSVLIVIGQISQLTRTRESRNGLENLKFDKIKLYLTAFSNHTHLASAVALFGVGVTTRIAFSTASSSRCRTRRCRTRKSHKQLTTAGALSFAEGDCKLQSENTQRCRSQRLAP